MSNRPTGFPLGKPIRIAEKHSGPSVYDTPFDSVAEACATIAEGVRGLGLTVKVLIAGKVVEYWWESGTTNAHLVQKATGTGGGNGGSTIQTIEVNKLSDIDNLNLSENLYIVKGGVKGQLIVVDDEAIQYSAELSGFYCVKGQVEYTGELANFTCIKSIKSDVLIDNYVSLVVGKDSYYATAQHPVASELELTIKGITNGTTFTKKFVRIHQGQTSSAVERVSELLDAYIFLGSPLEDATYRYLYTD